MKAFYAGSFDPFTNGHLEVVLQASQVFSQVVVAIGENPLKKRHFAATTMIPAIEQTLFLHHLHNVEVIAYQGLTITQAQAYQADFLIRGLRNGVDYDFEENLALINQTISGLKTIYFRASTTAHVSSSAVMDLWQGGVDIDQWLPAPVKALMFKENN